MRKSDHSNSLCDARLQRCLLATVVLAALVTAGPVVAADLRVKAPVYKAPPPAVVYSWTGCYVGVNAGYGSNRATSTYTDDPNARDPIQGAGSVLPPSYDTSGSGGVGGGQIGCNWQRNQFVVGIEVDIDAVKFSGSASATAAASGNPGTQIAPNDSLIGTGGFTANEQVSQTWLSTLRARAGLAITERLFVFGTAGLAIGQVTTTGSVTAGTVSGSFPISGNAIWSGSSSTTKTGFAIGAGAELALADHWTVKGEYIYFDLGHVTHPLSLVSNTLAGGGFPLFPTLGNATSRINGNIVRVGLNYKFDWGPVVARY